MQKIILNPLVSIGLPVYNAEKYLEECLNNLLSQTYENLEIVIFDNASTDKTDEICKKYLNNPKIRYFRRKENLGAARNFQDTFKFSKGKFFKWACYDDLISEDYIEKGVETMLQNPDVSICQGRIESSFESGTSHFKPYVSHENLESTPFKRLKKYLFRARKNHRCDAILGLIRSKDLEETNLLQPYIGSDFIMLADLATKGKFIFNEDITFYRRFVYHRHNKKRTFKEHMHWYTTNFKQRIFTPRLTVHLKTLQFILRSNFKLYQKTQLFYIEICNTFISWKKIGYEFYQMILFNMREFLTYFKRIATFKV